MLTSWLQYFSFNFGFLSDLMRDIEDGLGLNGNSFNQRWKDYDLETDSFVLFVMSRLV